MLTVQSLGCRCLAGSGLGKYMLNEDFKCYQNKSVYGCMAIGANWETTVAAFKNLQATVRNVSARMSAAGTVKVPSQLSTLVVDGRIGNTTALGVQFIGAVFVAAVPPDKELDFALKSTRDGQADIEKIAAYANEIAAYFNDVLINHPEALNPPPAVVERIVEIEKIIEKVYGTRFRPIGGLVLAAGFVTAIGLAATSIYFATREKPTSHGGDF